MAVRSDIVALLTDLDIDRSDRIGPGQRPQTLWHHDGRKFTPDERALVWEVGPEELLATAGYYGALADIARGKAHAAERLATLLAPFWAARPNASAREAFASLRGASKAEAIRLLAEFYPGAMEELAPDLSRGDTGAIP